MRFAPFRLPRSLTVQLLAVSVGSLLLVIVLIVAASAVVLSLPAASLVRDDLTSHAEHIEEGMVFDSSNRLIAIELSDRMLYMYDGLEKDVSYRVTDIDGITLYSSPSGPALTALQREGIDSEEQYSSETVNHVTLRLFTRTVQQRGKSYVIQVARSERLVFMLVTNASRIAITAGVVAMALGMVFFCFLMLWTSRRAVQPLRDASAVAANIAPRNLTARLDARRLPSELTPLIDAFNSALERLETGYKVQQEFLASAAHELKTPLALIRAEIEIGAQPGREHLLKDVDLMARQVHQLLHLAEVSEIRNFAFESCDASSVVGDAVLYLARSAERDGVKVDYLPSTEPVLIKADTGALFVLVKNLVENAIQHSILAGVVTVRVDVGGLTVRNNGPHIATEDFSRLYTRFWRGTGATHEGAGLGLAICDEIATAHIWQLNARNVFGPGGVEFRLTFEKLNV